MSQEEILKIVDNEPGIVRTKIHGIIGVSTATACQQITILINKKKELIGVSEGRNSKLYRRKLEHHDTK